MGTMACMILGAILIHLPCGLFWVSWSLNSGWLNHFDMVDSVTLVTHSTLVDSATMISLTTLFWSCLTQHAHSLLVMLIPYSSQVRLATLEANLSSRALDGWKYLHRLPPFLRLSCCKLIMQKKTNDLASCCPSMAISRHVLPFL